MVVIWRIVEQINNYSNGKKSHMGCVTRSFVLEIRRKESKNQVPAANSLLDEEIKGFLPWF